MRKVRRFGFACGLVSMVALGACGGQEAPPPQSPSAGQQGYAQAPAATGKKARSADRAVPAGVESDEAAPPPPAPAVPGATPPAAAQEPSLKSAEAPGATDPRARYARANVQLSEARRQLDVAAGQRDCANACRALDSMEKAAGQICELARSTEERRTCRTAEDQVGSAREKVKSACGECSKRP